MSHPDFLLLIEDTGKSHVITFHELERAFPNDPYIVEDAACLAIGFGFDVNSTCHISRWN